MLLALLTAAFALTLIVIDSLKLTFLILAAIAAAFILAVAGPGLVIVDDGLLMRCQVSHEAKFLMNFCWGPVTALGSIAAVFMHGALDVVWSILLLTVLVLFLQVYVDLILSDKDYF
ncbi:hypothetical protein [Prochlorococcus marinus]|uniref:Uncharacterized protein n=1 Tax=Prochlorococcus marinus (strain MIT 9303) TaxID=59922 RepID=A2C635_PROM3|nr:hypothetical protein [Prochlorococcus marinus]ABM76945.1 Hypothetical protein P9303_01901 [Prochlorococcus marinus str. MIT 9303]